MKNSTLIGTFLLFASLNSYAQDTTTVPQTVVVELRDTAFPPAILNSKPVGPIYKYKPAIDIPITLIGMGWSGYAFTKIYSKPSSSPEEVNALRKEDVNWFDRWEAGKYDEKTDKFSYIPFYVSMPLPLLLFIDKDMRKDAGKITMMYLEAVAVTGFFYTGATYLTNRYRPFTYNTSVPIEKRTSGGAKNSFLAGHTAVVATSTFFMAKVYSDYHPDSKYKWLFYTGATAATGWMVYMRLKSGHHFPTDILAGLGVGIGSGLLIPTFHKNKSHKRHDISFYPFSGESNGVTMVYRFK